MIATFFVIGLLGLLALGLTWWAVAGEIAERRRARAAVAWCPQCTARRTIRSHRAD